MSRVKKSHHTPQGFRNHNPTPAGGSFRRWQRERWKYGLPKIPVSGYRFESVAPDVAWLRHDRSQPEPAWVGHATFLLQLNGVTPWRTTAACGLPDRA